MKRFAKMYESEKTQIVVIRQMDDDGAPEVRFFFMPEGLGVCSSALQFEDTDEGYDHANECFSKVTKKNAEALVRHVMTGLGPYDVVHESSDDSQNPCHDRVLTGSNPVPPTKID